MPAPTLQEYLVTPKKLKFQFGTGIFVNWLILIQICELKTSIFEVQLKMWNDFNKIRH